VPLTGSELVRIVEIIDTHLEGMRDAREKMIDDTATLTDLDTFSETIADHDLDRDAVQRIRKKLLDDTDGGAD
jgi:hypothetical protein